MPGVSFFSPDYDIVTLIDFSFFNLFKRTLLNNQIGSRNLHLIAFEALLDLFQIFYYDELQVCVVLQWVKLFTAFCAIDVLLALLFGDFTKLVSVFNRLHVNIRCAFVLQNHKLQVLLFNGFLGRLVLENLLISLLTGMSKQMLLLRLFN